MQNTTNLNLKKPDYTDFADIQDINDNMDALDAAVHDTQNSVATFTSSDVADGSATSWTAVTKVDSGETHKSIFAKMSQMFKNIRFLYKMLGTTDISSIGNGTVTGGLSSLNSSLAVLDGKRLRYKRIYGTSSSTGTIDPAISASNVIVAAIPLDSSLVVFRTRRDNNKLYMAAFDFSTGQLKTNYAYNFNVVYVDFGNLIETT